MDCILNYNKSDQQDLYALLRCDESSSIEQILAEYKALSLECHPDKNPDNPHAVEKFQNIKKAKEILIDPEKRNLYDKWRNCGFSIPFEKFLNLSKSAHTSIHWACSKQKDLMLEGSCGDDKGNIYQEINEPPTQGTACHNLSWERDPANEVLRKFRNYEI